MQHEVYEYILVLSQQELETAIANQIRHIVLSIGRFDAEYFCVVKGGIDNFKIIAKSEKFFNRCQAKLAPEINAAESGLSMNKLMIYDGSGIDFVIALADKVYEIDAEVSTCTVRAKDLVAECMRTGMVKTDDFVLTGKVPIKLSTDMGIKFSAKNSEAMLSYLTDFLLELNDAKLLVNGNRSIKHDNVKPEQKEGDKFNIGRDVFINKMIFEAFNTLKTNNEVFVENVLRCDYAPHTGRYSITIDGSIAFAHTLKTEVDAKLKANGIQTHDSRYYLYHGTDSSIFANILYIAIDMLMHESFQQKKEDKLYMQTESVQQSITNDYDDELNQIVLRTLAVLRNGKQYCIDDAIVCSYHVPTNKYEINCNTQFARVLKPLVDKKLNESGMHTHGDKYVLYIGKSEQEFVLVLFIALQQLRAIKSIDAVTELNKKLTSEDKPTSDGFIAKCQQPKQTNLMTPEQKANVIKLVKVKHVYYAKPHYGRLYVDTHGGSIFFGESGIPQDDTADYNNFVVQTSDGYISIDECLSKLKAKIQTGPGITKEQAQHILVLLANGANVVYVVDEAEFDVSFVKSSSVVIIDGEPYSYGLLDYSKFAVIKDNDDYQYIDENSNIGDTFIDEQPQQPEQPNIVGDCCTITTAIDMKFTHPLQMEWKPQPDITIYELSLCLPYLVNHHTHVMPNMINQSEPHFRHFKITDPNI